jgi:competence protein ComEC
MAAIERVELISSKRDIFTLFALFCIFLSFSLSFQYYKYRQLTKFDSQIVHAKVLKQYSKTKLTKRGKIKNYQVLKLKSSDGFTFYTTASSKMPNYKGREVTLELWAGKITFRAYMKGFFAFSKILQVQKQKSFQNELAHDIAQEHNNTNATAIYQALFLAKPLPYHLQQTFSNLGISHLIAISGFHLGVLSAILFFIIKFPYKFLQNRYFPYRSYKRDSFTIIALLLFAYLLFLDVPPSLLRAYVMLVVGFVLYDRGIKIISMQTLLLSIVIILALFPRLIFSIGFFLSASGVFYIFLFLIHFKDKSKLFLFLALPFWIYFMMLPYSLTIFANFSLYHPLSILWSSLFTLFYPLSIFLHLIDFGDLLDGTLQYLIHLDAHAAKVSLNIWYLVAEIFLSLLAIFKKEALYLLLAYVIAIFIYAIYNVT